MEMTRTLRNLVHQEVIDKIPDADLPPALIVAAGGKMLLDVGMTPVLFLYESL